MPLEEYAFGRQKLIQGVVLEISTIVTLQNNNLCIELCFYDVIKVSKDRGNIRFSRDKKDPSKMDMVINKGYEPPFSR